MAYVFSLSLNYVLFKHFRIFQVNLLQYYKMATEEGQRTWQEACLYKCQPCWPAFETTSRKEFEGHLAAEHELGRSRYEVREECYCADRQRKKI